MHDAWTRELVLEQLIEAFEVDDALPIRVGPKAYGNAMPEVVREARDEFTAVSDHSRSYLARRSILLMGSPLRPDR